MHRLLRRGSVLAVLTAGMAGELGGQPRAAAADTVRARLAFTIDQESRTAPHGFGEVSGIAVDRQGRIYVADFKDTLLVVFSPDGRKLGTIGRQGRGPGEFNAPTGPAFGPDGALYVRDMERVMRFVTDPRTGFVGRYDAVFQGPPMANWRSKKSSRVDATGAFYFPDAVTHRDSGAIFSYIRYPLRRDRPDTIRIPRTRPNPPTTAWVRTSANGGRMVKGLNVVPFSPTAVWEATPRGTVLVGDGTSYAIQEIDAGGRVVRRFARSIRAEPIDAGERRDSARALKARIDSLPIRVQELEGATDDVKAQRLPSAYPPYTGVVAAEDGRVWVRRWPPARRASESFYDVFAADGTFQGTVVLPVVLAPEPSPVITADAVVGLVIDRDTELTSLVKLRFELRAPR